jgi:hypothetical protein
VAKDWVPYVVQQGDHAIKVAFRFGLSKDALWANPKNAALGEQRKKGDLLYPGDVLYVPAEPPEPLPLTSGGPNKYSAVVPTVPLKLELGSPSRSLGGQPFEVHGAEGEPIRGTTTGTGHVEVEVPVWVREVTVKLPKAGLVVPIRVGDLDPIEESSGAAQRLRNLGFMPDGHELDPAQLTAGVRAFQAAHGLEPNGELTAETQKALLDAHTS